MTKKLLGNIQMKRKLGLRQIFTSEKTTYCEKTYFLHLFFTLYNTALLLSY